MQNRASILQEVFSIENTSFLDQKKKIFLSIRERGEYCVIYEGYGSYKCLKINTTYNPQEVGILSRISDIFFQKSISIFAFTSIHHGYFFFEEKLQKDVETTILSEINNFLY